MVAGDAQQAEFIAGRYVAKKPMLRQFTLPMF